MDRESNFRRVLVHNAHSHVRACTHTQAYGVVLLRQTLRPFLLLIWWLSEAMKGGNESRLVLATAGWLIDYPSPPINTFPPRDTIIRVELVFRGGSCFVPFCASACVCVCACARILCVAATTFLFCLVRQSQERNGYALLLPPFFSAWYGSHRKETEYARRIDKNVPP